MARYKLILAYDGTNFHGSQYQADARTVQGELESSLRRLGWADKSVVFAGRTDAGVHAAGQVAAFDLNWQHPLHKLRNALNALLPADLAVRQITPVAPSFHPRFGALSRSYVYQIYCQPTRNPLRDRFAWQVWPQPNFDILTEAAAIFPGVHNFSGFGTPTRPGGSTIRALTVAAWQTSADELHFRVTANAFLYHMVRRLVFVQIRAGQGNLSLSDLISALEDPQGPPLQGLAPPQGLSLVDVQYPPEDENK